MLVQYDTEHPLAGELKGFSITFLTRAVSEGQAEVAELWFLSHAEGTLNYLRRER